VNNKIVSLLPTLWNSSTERFRKIVGVSKEYLYSVEAALFPTKQRQEPCVGRPLLLSTLYQLTFVFLWMKHYMQGELLGLICGMTRSSVSTYVHKVLDLVYSHYRLLDLVRYPSFSQRKEQGCYFQDWLLTTVIDCTEQQQADSNDKLTSRAKYSGKQGAPTWSKLLAVGLRGLIFFISQSFLGSNNDPAVYMKPDVQIHTNLRETEAMAGDMAFEFINHYHKIFTTKQSEAEGAIEYNKEFVPIRLVVENTIGVLKLRWQILRNIFHHNKETHEKVWYIACSIHNEELMGGGKELRSDQFFVKNKNRK